MKTSDIFLFYSAILVTCFVVGSLSILNSSATTSASTSNESVSNMIPYKIGSSGVRGNGCEILTGKWVNELQSVVTLKVFENEIISGSYNTSVGDASYSDCLIGFVNEGKYGCVVTFSVAWNMNDPSTPTSSTVWSGEVFFSNPKLLPTTWMLVSDGEDDDYWASTIVNSNYFIKTHE